MHQKKESPMNGGNNASAIQQNQQPLFSKIRSLNHFTITSLDTLFSGNISSKLKTGPQNICGGSESVTPSIELGRLERGTRRHADTVDADSGSQVDCTSALLEGSNADLASRGRTYNRRHAGDCCATRAHDETITNTHSNSGRSPKTPHTSTHFPEMRIPFGKISTSSSHFFLAPGNPRFSIGDGGRGGECSESISSSEPMSYIDVFPSSSGFDGSVLSSPFESQLISQQGLSGVSATPPLTPDSSNNEFLSLGQPHNSLTDSSLTSYNRFSSQFGSLILSDGFLNSYRSENDGVYNGLCLREIKEGKKPEKMDNHTINGESDVFSALDDPEEWYGLEYTLEASSRQTQPSESQSFCVGEHSKSRESWAALHKGTVHPFFEDEDYRQWKNWHLLLDLQDEKKRHKKSLEFKSRSKDLAWIYVDEIRTRDVLYWQKEVFGVVARDLKDRLKFLVERRPDPYFPPQGYNWSSGFKRSRSLSCLRELVPQLARTGDCENS